ncbi:undecaprenyl-diphosphate phosphatase [Flaviaesturariibacter amylovorans]|uniref:Undecaprenyl-diphosphatase n=1 Tax=Flaviaesturariibacter amylovorans TaxID=1084520 RepID=A0ABP8G607_9BACT
MTLLEAIVIAVVEGLTEFLPVSSTGHMIIASSFLGIEEGAFTKLFEVAIQLGAIFAVVLVYWRKFFQFTKWEFYAKLAVGVIPALLFGFLFNDAIDAMLSSQLIVAASLLLGGIVLLFIDRLFPQPSQPPSDILATETTQREVIEADDRLTYPKAFIIGLWQVLAMIPGVSRSAASIIGGMQQRLTRNFAAEFSFFLAVPTMAAATLYSVFLKKWDVNGTEQKGYELIMATSENMKAFLVGNVVAFVVALIAIKFFISVLKRYGFRIFGIYRIVLGAILLVLIAMGKL